MIREYVGMAQRVALRVARRVPDWLSKDDLISAAMVGLVEAAERYDSTRAEPFCAFAEQRIRGAVLDELRRGDVLPRRVRARARQIGRTIQKLEQKLGRAPEDDEVAEALDVPLETYQGELKAQVHLSLVDLDFNSDRSADLISTEHRSPLEGATRSQLLRRVRDALPKLQERDALILSLYYEKGLTYKEIGHVLEVSESRVCQLHSRAIARLRVEIEER